MKSFVSSLALAFSLAAALAARPAAAEETAAPPESALTADETALSKGIFGGMLDAGIVRKVMQPMQCGKMKEAPAAYVNLNDPVHVNFCGHDNHVYDYARSGAAFAVEFLHEMTHIVQAQKHSGFTRGTLVGARKSADYNYTLSPRVSFKAYGAEQQAQMVEDYAGVTFYGLPLSKACRNAHDIDAVRLLQDRVETMFPAARKTRLAFEATPAGREIGANRAIMMADEFIRARFSLKARENFLESLSEQPALSRYAIDAARPFYMYAREQQDAMEKDYIAVVRNAPLSPSCASPDTPENRRLLMRVVEKDLPGALELKHKALREMARHAKRAMTQGRTLR